MLVLKNNEFSQPRLSKDEAAAKIQALYRGWKVRQLVVKPGQIIPSLKDHLLEMPHKQKTVSVIAIDLCRGINEMIFNGKKYLEKSKDLSSLFFKCWLEMSDDDSVGIMIVFPDKLGEGAFHTVYKAQLFQIKKGGKEVRYIPSVCMEEKPDAPLNAKLRKFMALKSDHAAKGKEIQRSLQNLGKFAVTPRECLPSYAGSSQDSCRGWIRGWYNSDLAKAAGQEKVPLDLQCNAETLPFSKADALQIFIDVARSLEKMHERGYIHRDVKRQNILVKVDQEKKFGGYLSDFDLATTIGESQGITNDNYPYWDKCCRAGWPLTFTDLYGLMVSLVETFVPGFAIGKDTTGKDCKNYFKEVVKNRLSAKDPGLYQQLSEQEASFDKFNDLIKSIDSACLQDFQAELILAHETLRIASIIVGQNDWIFQFFSRNSDLKRILDFGTPDQKKRTASSIEMSCWSAAKFRQELEKVQKLLAADSKN